MKKVFTLAMVMALAITGFAQTRGLSSKSVKAEPVQQHVYTGLEDINVNFPASSTNIMQNRDNEEVIELGQTYYDWQSNAGPRNYTAVWPDGFAAMCYTVSGEELSSGMADRGTGISWFDPATGEWEVSNGRVENEKTGFGSIARYKENGLVVVAHTSTNLKIYINEDFRNDPTNFGAGIAVPSATGIDPVWGVIQCSGEDLDIIHILYTNNNGTEPYGDALLYARYENGEWTVANEALSVLTDHVSDGGANMSYFMQYDPQKPNRVAFVLNNAWCDGMAVISEDNGATWNERVFYQHPGLNETFDSWFFFPRWTSAAFDNDDNLHVVYEYNGSTGAAGSGTYYPAIGGVSYWSEILPKHDSCVGGIGEFGEPFIMDSTYIIQDLYMSEEYWSDKLHLTLPEYMGRLAMVNENGEVVEWGDETGMWPTTSVWSQHGAYNCGKAGFATMHYDKASDRIFAFWSQIAGDGETLYFDGTNCYFRLFCNISFDGGQTWEGEKQLITDELYLISEMVYTQVIPYVYTDSEGDYLWVCFQRDDETGTCVQEDESVWDNNFYNAVKVYVHFMDVEDNPMVAATTMNVYPNPAQGSFKVALNNASDVNIYNTVGQLVKSYNNVTEVNVALESGVYFVNANNQTTKVVVK